MNSTAECVNKTPEIEAREAVNAVFPDCAKSCPHPLSDKARHKAASDKDLSYFADLPAKIRVSLRPQ